MMVVQVLRQEAILRFHGLRMRIIPYSIANDTCTRCIAIRNYSTSTEDTLELDPYQTKNGTIDEYAYRQCGTLPPGGYVFPDIPNVTMKKFDF